MPETDKVMQTRCVHCLREQYAPAVYPISLGEQPCVWCGEFAPIFETYDDWRAALKKRRHELAEKNS